MKTNLFKRMSALFIACMMLFLFSTTAFAANNFITESVSIPSNSTQTIKIGSLSTGHTGTFRIQSSGSDSNGTFSWKINKGSNPVFKSGTTYVNDTFVQNYYYLDAGTYYATITNNSSRAITVIVTFEW